MDARRKEGLTLTKRSSFCIIGTYVDIETNFEWLLVEFIRGSFLKPFLFYTNFSASFCFLFKISTFKSLLLGCIFISNVYCHAGIFTV